MQTRFPWHRFVGYESRKAYDRRVIDGFWNRFVRGPVVIDLGWRGAEQNALPICEDAVGIDLGTPGYDGRTLPYDDCAVDCVHASHLLEHVEDTGAALREWFRVLRIGGTMIVAVPHAMLYERRLSVPPSRWSGEHLRCYTPATLLAEVERSLQPNTYRVRHLSDDDTGYDYLLPKDSHPTGCLEILMVLERINPPSWNLDP